MYVHPANCPGDCCAYDALTDDLATGFLTSDPVWHPPTRQQLDHLRKTSRPTTPAARNPAPT